MYIYFICLFYTSYMSFLCILHIFKYSVLLTYFLFIQSQTLIIYLPSCINTNNKAHFLFIQLRDTVTLHKFNMLFIRLIFCLFSQETQSFYINSVCYLQGSFSVHLAERYRLIFCSSSCKMQSLYINSICYLYRLILF